MTNSLSLRPLPRVATTLALCGLAWGCKLDPEEMAALEQKRQAALAAYTGPLGKAYATLAATDWSSQKPIPCEQKVLHDLATEDDGQSMGPRLMLAYGPFLQRFSEQPDYQAGLGDWKWLTDSAWRGHFDEEPEGEGWASGGTVDRIEDTFLPSGSLIVVWPTSKENRIPQLDPSSKSFHSGSFVGWAVLVSQKSGEVVCQYPLSVSNTNQVEFRQGGRKLAKLFDEKPAEAIQKDFEDNFEDALEAGLPKRVSIRTGLGGLF